MEKFRVGIIGATGMVGQRFVLLTANHPWFTPVVLAASAHSAGKPYAEAIGEKWHMADPIPESVRSMVVMDAEADAEEIAKQVDFVFCAVNMKKDEIKALEERYAKLECPVVSNNSAHRHTPDVPMVVPEINADHIRIIDAQRKRLGTKRGFIAVKSNCSLQSYVPALHPLMKYGIEKALVCTYQAISGAGKTFDTWPEMLDNVIPYIGGEEEKSEQEPMKLWGHIEGDQIVNATEPNCACRSPTGIWLPALSRSRVRSRPSNRLRLTGPRSPAARRNWSCRRHPSSSCTTLKSRTARRRSLTG